MRQYTVKELSDVSGVSTRTLHYYDELGLLKPALRTDSGYRNYGVKELLRLQQILFYKELEFPLKKIMEVLNEPNFNLIEALKKHRQSLKDKSVRIQKLLQTIDNTIEKLEEQDEIKTPNELYTGLAKTAIRHRAEALEKFGEYAIHSSEKSLTRMGKEGVRKLQSQLNSVMEQLFFHRHKSPEATKVRELINTHFKTIILFWGKSVPEGDRLKAYAGLGQLYLSDSRYTMIDGHEQYQFALFLQKAMQFYVDSKAA